MKKYLHVAMALIICILCLAASCKKNKDSDPLEQLPPETQTGANTFGCLVNGNVFKPKSTGSLLPILSSYYQFIYPGPNGFVFNVSAVDERECCFRSVYINIDSAILEERKYILTKLEHGTAGGGFRNGIDYNSKVYLTTQTVTGELIIKKFDQTNQIVAGTFWYNAVNAIGDTIKISNGRFDVKYTR